MTVINALKHGFPAGATGEILVGYDAQDTGWRLSVADNGSGAQADGPAHTGLGTSIVEALAHQLEATVEKTSGAQGTTVTITAPAINAGIATDEKWEGARDRISPGRS